MGGWEERDQRGIEEKHRDGEVGECESEKEEAGETGEDMCSSLEPALWSAVFSCVVFLLRMLLLQLDIPPPFFIITHHRVFSSRGTYWSTLLTGSYGVTHGWSVLCLRVIFYTVL
jgi:hypothetical protein